MPDWRIAQRYALACIYYSTLEGLASVSATTTLNAWMVEPNECQWHGINCDFTEENNGVLSSYGPVTESNFSHYDFTGLFPIEVTLLQDSLRSLTLLGNPRLSNTGDEQVGWLGDLTQLTVLDLTKGGFEYDGLPPQLAQLTNLQRLSLPLANFHGPLNETIFQTMDQLKILDLTSISLQSTIPTIFKTLPNLQRIYMGYSGLTGGLQDAFDGQGFAQLVEFKAEGNALGGSLPTTLALLTTLQRLDLSSCGITGTIPTELSDLNNLRILRLNDNFLHQSIPAALANLTQLEELHLYSNDLTGSMPDDICANRNDGGP